MAQSEPQHAVINASGSGNNTLVSAVAGKSIRVLAGHLVAAGAVSVRLESGASGTALTGVIPLTSDRLELDLSYNPVGWCETSASALLNLELSGAVSCQGLLTYVLVD